MFGGMWKQLNVFSTGNATSSIAVGDDNGLIFCNSIFIPREVVANILSFVHPRQLARDCRLVCKNWNNIVENDVWRIKVRRSNPSTLKSFSNLCSTDRKRLRYQSFVLYQICLGDPFEKNLLLNNCGQMELKHWQPKTPARNRGPRDLGFTWSIENPPVGADPLPECEDFGQCTSCFSTSYCACVKEQIIDLSHHHIFPRVMDEIQPKIVVSEWYAGRFDCGCTYKLTAYLLDEKRKILQQKEENRRIAQWGRNNWEKVVIEFENYGPGVRFIIFNHVGQDTQFWAGQYGSKMAGGVVKICLPNSISSSP